MREIKGGRRREGEGEGGGRRRKVEERDEK